MSVIATEGAVSSQALAETLERLVRDERRLVVEFLVALGELDARRLYAELGYSSSFDFLLRRLHRARVRRFGA